LGIALSLEHNLFRMRPMPEQRGYSQQHGDDRHGQPEPLFAVFVCVFRAFFDLFYIHVLVRA
jgi:hypothetical protein